MEIPGGNPVGTLAQESGYTKVQGSMGGNGLAISGNPAKKFPSPLNQARGVQTN
jgi:hypothetical protein